MTDLTTQKWKTNRLGFAAYVKLSGAKVVGVSGHYFEFESTKCLIDWEVEYANSDERRFNDELIGLNQLRKGK